MPHACAKAGFTLVEMLAVLFIVSILLGIVLGSARYASQVSRISRAESDLHVLADALDRFYLVFGEYPRVESATNLLTFTRDSLNFEDGASSKRIPFEFANLLPTGFTALDPWSHPYIYRVRSTERGNDAEPEPQDEALLFIASCGPDGKEGTDDDIAAP